jgi:CheY-like chemotaxis protein/Tfp pilus assembly protein PilZ
MAKTEKGQGSDINKQIVLVVDGRPIRQFYTSTFLQRLNYHVITAKTAEDGLSFLNLTVPLVIIVNIDLPDMSGADLLKRVKKNSRTRDVPVIIYTSNKDDHIQQDCEQAGCAAYLRHPATLEELYAAVQKATQRPRRFVRLDTFLDVVVGDGNPSGKDYIAVISELGMFVCTNSALSFGSVHLFTFHLPNAPGWVFKIEGQVVYNQSSEERKQPGIGVKFLKIGTREREFIRDFIRQKLMEGITPI